MDIYRKKFSVKTSAHLPDTHMNVPGRVLEHFFLVHFTDIFDIHSGIYITIELQIPCAFERWNLFDTCDVRTLIYASV